MWHMCLCTCGSVIYVYLAWLVCLCLLVNHQYQLKVPVRNQMIFTWALQNLIDSYYSTMSCVKTVTRHHLCRGFCYFNSVAIAAKLLQQRLNVSKILIVDWVSDFLPRQAWKEHACPPVSPIDNLTEHGPSPLLTLGIRKQTELSENGPRNQRSKVCTH